MRAVIYARYSSENQREASIEDQVEICRRLIAREGWKLTEVYADKAVSGASRFRSGYQQLIAEADRRSFDVVVCESLDRLGRKLADVASLYDQLTYLGIRLHTVSTGEVTPLHIGMLGTMAQMYLNDLRDKTRRGLLGKVLEGKSAGGLAYGYEIDRSEGSSGKRRVKESEAAVIRRVFEAYASGASPREIAKRLNAETVPGPGGRPWRDTSIRGQAERGTGLLNNPAYVGRMEWNRCSYVKDPRTGKRVARVNPKSAWEIVEVPELRIVPDALWEKVKARQATLKFEIARTADGNALNRAHRRKFLFSGLLVCGACGGGYTIIGKDTYGCAHHRSSGMCTNGMTVGRKEIEERILFGLKGRLMAPDMVEEFAREYQAEMNRLSREREQETVGLRIELAAIERKLAGLVRAIEDGMYNPTMKDRMTALEGRKAEIKKALDAAPSAAPVRIHPNLSRIYRDKVSRLEDALYEDATRDEAGEVIRALIDRIVLTPRDGGLAAELHGELASILALCAEAAPKRKLPGTDVPGSQLSVVAGVGFEPTTFRL